MSKKRNNLIALLGVLSLVLITSGVSLAFFNYTKSGSNDNTITTGSITFIYDEESEQGRGITLTDAIPISNELGKANPTNVFNFRITSTTLKDVIIPYEVTARMSSDSDSILQNVVNIYLTNQQDNEEFLDITKYSELEKYKNNPNERIIYRGEVPENSSGQNSYNQDFRLRMWIDEDTDYSEGTYNNKTFKITVNIYAQGAEVTPEIENARKDVTIRSVKIGDGIAEKKDDTTFEIVLPDGVDKTTLDVNPTNTNAKVEIKQNNVTIKNKSIVTLEEGTNTYDVKITSKDGSKNEEYTLNIISGGCTGGYYGLKCSCDNSKLIAWQDGPYLDTNNNAMDSTRVLDSLYPPKNTYQCGCSDGSVGYVVNTGQLLESSCPVSGGMTYTDANGNNELDKTEEVCYQSECFYVLDKNEDEIKLFSKYNLKVGNNVTWTDSDSISSVEEIKPTDPGYGLQDATMKGYYYGDDATYPYVAKGTVAFSGNTYWNTGNDDWSYVSEKYRLDGYDKGTYSNTAYTNLYDKTLISEPLYSFSDTGVSAIPGTRVHIPVNQNGYLYTAKDTQNQTYSVAYYIENYANTLKTMGLNVTDARLLLASQDDLIDRWNDTCLNYYGKDSWDECKPMFFMSYWTGQKASGYSHDVDIVMNCGTNGCSNGNYSSDSHFGADKYGVRPVIIVPASTEFTKTN